MAPAPKGINIVVLLVDCVSKAKSHSFDELSAHFRIQHKGIAVFHGKSSFDNQSVTPKIQTKPLETTSSTQANMPAELRSCRDASQQPLHAKAEEESRTRPLPRHLAQNKQTAWGNAGPVRRRYLRNTQRSTHAVYITSKFHNPTRRT